MRLYGVRIFVEDFEKARAFYGETLQLRETWVMPEANAAGYDLESAELIVEQEDMDGGDGNLIGRFVGASLEVDDIEAVYTRNSVAAASCSRGRRSSRFGAASWRTSRIRQGIS